MDIAAVRACLHLRGGHRYNLGLGGLRARLPLLRHLAAHHQHWHPIITFLMVFLIQNTQNRDTTAIQLKLDELIRANENARDQMLRLEDLTENQIKQLKESFGAALPIDAIRQPLEGAQQRLAKAAARMLPRRQARNIPRLHHRNTPPW